MGLVINRLLEVRMIQFSHLSILILDVIELAFAELFQLKNLVVIGEVLVMILAYMAILFAHRPLWNLIKEGVCFAMTRCPPYEQTVGHISNYIMFIILSYSQELLA